MLIQKSGNSTKSLIPLTTGYITDSEHTSEAYSSFKMNMMCSPDKVVFPGENAAFAARYACFDTSTNEYISTKGTVTTNGGGGNGGHSEYYNDAYYMNNLEAWKYDFHRISNWRDYATYKTDETESANYISNETTPATKYNEIDNYNVYNVQIKDTFTTTTDYIPTSESGWWITRPGSLTAEISLVFQDTFEDGEPDEWCYVLATNNVRTSLGWTTSVSAYFTAHCENVRDWANIHRTWPTWTDGTDYVLVPYPIGNKYYLTRNSKVVGWELYYKSATSAVVENIKPLTYESDITGNDVHFKFNSEGTNVTGSAYTGTNTSHTAKITADVGYVYVEKVTSSSPEVSSNDHFNTYDWKTRGYNSEIGGGGAFSYNFTSYLPNKNTKWAIYPRKNTKFIGYDANSYYNLSSKRIQDSYGGSILFSGENLDNYWNDGLSRYFFIGFKGMNPYVTGNSCYSTTSNNTEMKIYKFNSDHFRKISENTYYFEDKDISKIYANATASIANTNYRRHYAIGPQFYEFTGFIKTYDSTGGEHYNFNMTTADNITHYVTPKVLNNIQYVNTLDIDEADDYFIVKPANSISISYDPSLYNNGNTDTYSYFAYRNLPTYWNDSIPPFRLNSNATEITKLGKTLKWGTQIYGSNTNLTAIKTDWTYCNKVHQMCFSGTPLKQIPNSWNGLTELTALLNGFDNCTQLSTIPDSWVGLTKLAAAADLFHNCSNLNAIPSSWNGLGSLTGAPAMFANCSKITTIPNDWSPLVNFTYAPEMFSGCTQLTGINSWQGWKITDSKGMFANCTHLIKVPNSWNGLGSVTITNGMFADCTDLTTIPTDLFKYCTNLTELSAMFSGCTSLTSDVQPIMDAGNAKIGLPDWTGFSGTFKGCTGVKNYNTLTANTAYKNWFGL